VSLPHRGLPDGPVTVAIRPEAVRLGASPAGAAGVAGTVVKAAYLGSHMEYTVSSPIGELFVIDPSVAERLIPGTPVAIRLADHGVTVVR
jgi:iron(III) transport system ATP-binding protein